VYAITYVQTQSRRKEVGSLLAIGFGKKDIYMLFLKELCFVTSLSSIIAFLFYELLIGAFGTGIELSLNVPLKGQNTIYELILFVVLLIMNGIFAAISVGCSLDYMYKSEASELLD
jgi:ABC-type antimicrobial peptide transport system permease subunit